ncbi:DinB family protein [Aequorivita sp. SDUM287046]|uniref:DinB family protein n=1 Tax=Aequorivita aurantiaca TaxID=3053356 RepID=A0ABT8DHK9_9FLAO|nr:DinB family protein [Aequorivita aurantiaca]MDN3723441.1 DinB family protein [Aequorivita aurantiaca]
MYSKNITEVEFNPYYKHYLELVENDSLMEALHSGLESTSTYFRNLPEEKWCFQYAADKWTPKDILQHIADTERVFSYRALYFARSTDAVLKGFDENVFAQTARANQRTVDDLLENYRNVRLSTLSLFKNFDELQLIQTGNANGSNMSVRAAGFIICGHEIHHRNIITQRYL